MDGHTEVLKEKNFQYKVQYPASYHLYLKRVRKKHFQTTAGDIHNN